jgi:predicted permease
MVGFDQVLALFLLILFGFIIKKAKFISDVFQKELSGFVINVALPAFIISSVSVSVSNEMLKNTGVLLIIGVILFALSILLSEVLTRVMSADGQAKDIFQFVLTFPNVAYMGYPVVAVAYGEVGVFYAAVVNLIFNILIWSLGVYFMKRNCDSCEIQSEHMTLGKRVLSIMNPALYALFIGFALAVFKIQIPTILLDTIKMVGGTTSPLTMMFIGFILTDVHIKELVGDYRLYVISFFRLIGFPLIFYFLISPFIEGELLGVLILLMGMPAAVNTAVLAARYENDYRLASKIVFISTLGSIVTIPIMIKLIVA